MRLSQYKAAFFCSASLFALTTAAAAQTASDENAMPETVVVTGSRVISDIANSPTPITAVTASQLTQTSPQSITVGLEKLPIFMGSTGADSGGKPGGASNGAADNLNLRNMGANRNLVLFDSHRVIQTQANGAVNVDVLPEMLVQRVDIVTGGASAVYGSDAVTGVINYILDKNFDGIKYEANAGAMQNGDADQFQVGVAAGEDVFGGKGHIEGTVRYSHTDAVADHNLPYGKNGQVFAYGCNASSCSGAASAPYYVISDARRNDDPFGGLIGCAGCSVNGETFVQNGIIGPYDEGTVIAGTLSNGGTGRRDLFTDFTPMTHNIESFGRMSYDINDNTVASVEFRGSEAGAYALGPNNGLPPGSGASARPNIFAVTNPYLTAATQAQLAKGNPGCPGGVPTDISIAPGCTFSFANYMSVFEGSSQDSYPGVSGQQSSVVKGGLPTFNYNGLDREMAFTADLTGELDSRWDWDVFYQHDEAREKDDAPVNQNFQSTYAAEDAVLGKNGNPVCYVSTTIYASLYPNCDPINPFGPDSLSPSEYASFTYQTQYVMTNAMDDVGGNVSGSIFDLPAGPVKASLSAEGRWMSYSVQSNANPAQVNCTGLRLCSTVVPLWYQTTLASIAPVSERIFEVAGEVNVPLLKDLPLVQDLSADIAGRYTDYSVSGDAETWKVGLDYHVIDDLKFRGTISVDIRAPTLNELFQPLAIGNSSLADVLTGKSADLSAYSAGNPNLKPEVAHTYTVGTVLTPTWFPNFTASIDYYRIRLYDAITSITYTTLAIQDICLASGGASQYCSLAVRPYPITNTTTANFPSEIINKSLNSAKQYTEGVDFEMDYNFDLDDVIGVPGAISLKNLYSYQPYVTNIAFPATATTPAALPAWTAMPKSRDTLFVNYSLGNWAMTLQDKWLGGYDQNTTYGQYFLTEQDRHIPNYNEVDITIDKKFAMDDSVVDGFLTVNNVINTPYPIAPSLTSASNPGTYPGPVWGTLPNLGRYFLIGVRGNL